MTQFDYDLIQEIERRRQGRKVFRAFCWAVVLAVALCIVALVAGGCSSTVRPAVVHDRVASWDGTNQNSGFLGYMANGSGVITPHGLARYQGLVAAYGARFNPALTNAADGVSLAAVGAPVFDDGKQIGTVPAGCYRIDQGHLEKLWDMNRWRKQGLSTEGNKGN
jgi:hypothetical protein